MKILCLTTLAKYCSFNDYSIIVLLSKPHLPQKIKIKGPYIACDVTNVNGRIYKFLYFLKSVIPEYMKVWVTPKRAYAELNHANSHVVNPKDACLLILDLVPLGKSYIGLSIVLNSDTRLGVPGTPNGDILAAILLHGGKIGKSTRGAVDNPNNKVIDLNNMYTLITVDSVLDPSGPGCYINDIVMLLKDFMVNLYGIVVECAYDSLKHDLDSYKTTHDQAKKQQHMLKAFNNFIENLKK